MQPRFLEFQYGNLEEFGENGENCENENEPQRKKNTCMRRKRDPTVILPIYLTILES